MKTLLASEATKEQNKKLKVSPTLKRKEKVEWSWRRRRRRFSLSIL